MTSLRDLLETTVESGRVPGAAALVAHGEDVEIAGAGEVEPEAIVGKLPVFGPRETPDEWLATLAQVPMLRQPGEAWLYNTCSDVQGVLIARGSAQPLPEFLAERIFEPLGMTDTGFDVPPEKLD